MPRRGPRIRKATSCDLPRLRELSAYTGIVSPRAGDEPRWERVLASPEGHAVIVAEGGGGDLCGYALFQSSWEGKLHLQDLVVEPAMRGRGVAKALVRHVIKEARRRSSPEVYLEVLGTNRTARGLYESLGFKTRIVIPGLIGGRDLIGMRVATLTGRRTRHPVRDSRFRPAP